MLTVQNEHQCKTIENQDSTAVAIQQFDNGYWYWINYKTKRPQLNGVKFCPYCGMELPR